MISVSSSQSRPSTAFANVDFEKVGKQTGFVMIPHSPHDDAWGVTRVPIAVIKNGRGPTVILEGGNHGDEYEGPISICELIKDLDPRAVEGRLILMPANNVHAVQAGMRTSPVDGLNYNRTFPGDPRGTITQQISAYLADIVFPLGDAFLDLHSGGSSLDLMPSAIIEPTEDVRLHKLNVAAALAFDAPVTVIVSNLGDPRTATATACRSGLITVGTEMGGGGRVSLPALECCRRGVRNVLGHLGVIEHRSTEPVPSDRKVYELPGTKAFVFSSSDGIFEPFHENGIKVQEGQPAGVVHCTWDPSKPSELLRYQSDGFLYGRRSFGRVKPGNCCLVVAAPFEGTRDD